VSISEYTLETRKEEAYFYFKTIPGTPVFTCISMYLRLWVRKHASARVHTHTHTHTRTHTHMHANTHAHTHTHAHIKCTPCVSHSAADMTRMSNSLVAESKQYVKGAKNLRLQVSEHKSHLQVEDCGILRSPFFRSPRVVLQ